LKKQVETKAMEGEKGMSSSTDFGNQNMEPGLDKKTANHSNATNTADKKKEEILEACRRRDLSALRALAESPGGFLTDSIRQQACK
jgi:transposase